MSGARILDLRWSAILNDFRRSGLTHAAFCHRRELSIHTFRKRLYAAAPPCERRPPIVLPPVTAPHSYPSPSFPIRRRPSRPSPRRSK